MPAASRLSYSVFTEEEELPAEPEPEYTRSTLFLPNTLTLGVPVSGSAAVSFFSSVMPSFSTSMTKPSAALSAVPWSVHSCARREWGARRRTQDPESSSQSVPQTVRCVSRSKSYINGADYATLAKEQYKCEDVTITQKEDNLYSAKARVIRTYENEIATYEVNFTFKVNSNYKYQKYKLLSLDAEVTSSNVDTTIHLVNN